MKRVLVLLKYTTPGSPQDQQRGPIYASLFRAAGIDVRYVGRYPISVLGRGRADGGAGRTQRLSSLARKVGRKIFDAFNDLRILRIARGYDVIVLVKVDTPSLVRRLRRDTRARLVYDLADVRSQGATGTDEDMNEILAAVDAITVDNALGLAYAREHGASVYLWPPVSYVETFDLHRARSRRGRDGRVVIGWVGTPSTASNLYLILESLEDVFRRHANVDLRLVGLSQGHDLVRRFEHVRASCRPTYDATVMIREVIDMDIGLFPMFDLQDAAMHGTTKALIYMGGGAVAVCSPVGETVKLVRDGENGMLAGGRDDWIAKLDALIRDPGLRAKLSEAGIATVREDYSLEQCFAHLRRAIGV